MYTSGASHSGIPLGIWNAHVDFLRSALESLTLAELDGEGCRVPGFVEVDAVMSIVRDWSSAGE